VEVVACSGPGASRFQHFCPRSRHDLESVSLKSIGLARHRDSSPAASHPCSIGVSSVAQSIHGVHIRCHMHRIRGQVPPCCATIWTSAMELRRIALIYDTTLRPETAGVYSQRALSRLAEVEQFQPHVFSATSSLRPPRPPACSGRNRTRRRRARARRSTPAWPDRCAHP
jgi:hypothetical protein